MDDIAKFVRSEVIETANELRQTFVSAAPFRHVVIDDFFEPAFCRRLVQEFPAFDRERAINEDGEIGGKSVTESVVDIGPEYRQLDQLVQGDAFRQLIGRITDIDELEYDEYYFGGGTHENLHGQELDTHVDFNYHPESRHHRRLNLIVYLNEQWEKEWGGALELHRDPYRMPDSDEIKSVLPIMNRCVIFETTEHSWHGFRRIDLPEDKRQLSRQSFALYFYTRERPEEEVAGPHSTVYVDRHLPDHIQPGYSLKEQDLQDIQILLARRDQHLKRLYASIQDLMTQLEAAKERLEYLEDVCLEGVSARIDINNDTPSDRENLRLQQELVVLERRLSKIENSNSWRMTAPLRAVRRMLGSE